MLLVGPGDGPDSDAESHGPVAELDAASLAGQRLIAGWDGEAVPRGLRRQIRSGGVAGVILFADNIPSPARARRTIRRLQRLPRPAGLEAPLLAMVDQEGGRVRRLDAPPVESAAEIGARGQEYAFAQGRRTGEALSRLGFNVDLAPVLDVARPGGAIEAEQRAYAGDAAGVIAAGVEGFAAGLREGGVLATAKHFPGIGAARVNTDRAPQRIELPDGELEEVDEAPFAAFVDAGGELVMLGLAAYEGRSERPAAFSPKLVQGELRGRLGFEGVTITDGLGAAAAAEFGDPRQVALAAERAGNDLLLYSDWRAARDARRLLARRLRRGDLDSERFGTAAARVLELRDSLAQGE